MPRIPEDHGLVWEPRVTGRGRGGKEAVTRCDDRVPTRMRRSRRGSQGDDGPHDQSHDAAEGHVVPGVGVDAAGQSPHVAERSGGLPHVPRHAPLIAAPSSEPTALSGGWPWVHACDRWSTRSLRQTPMR